MLSPYIWVYFVVTVGSTCLTISTWYYYTRRHANDFVTSKQADDLESQRKPSSSG